MSYGHSIYKNSCHNELSSLTLLPPIHWTGRSVSGPSSRCHLRVRPTDVVETGSPGVNHRRVYTHTTNVLTSSFETSPGSETWVGTCLPPPLVLPTESTLSLPQPAVSRRQGVGPIPGPLRSRNSPTRRVGIDSPLVGSAVGHSSGVGRRTARGRGWVDKDVVS